ncbi:hypothetical protein ACFE04_012977 [Oxalis oulophora]
MVMDEGSCEVMMIVAVWCRVADSTVESGDGLVTMAGSGSDIAIVIPTDSLQALSLDESLWWASAFDEAGADILFIDALGSREEMRAIMLEGGGKTPNLIPSNLTKSDIK